MWAHLKPRGMSSDLTTGSCVFVCVLHELQFDVARGSFVCSMEEEGDVVADYR